MHKNFEIEIKNLSKIEGHANLHIKARNGKVESAKLIVGQNKRFYEKAVMNKQFLTIPQMVSRICGTCSIAHLTCAAEAIEKALDVKVSKQTQTLRALATYGTILRDHAMHLYFFVLPDIFGKNSVMDFEKKHYHLITKAFDTKAAGNALAKFAAGRAIHATYANIGYFSHIPEKDENKKVISQLKNSRNNAIELIELMAKSGFSFKRKTNYVALADKHYAFLEGKILDGEGLKIPEKQFGRHFDEVVVPYSQGQSFKFKGTEYLVGALARMNLNKNSLHKNTKKDVKKWLGVFPSDDIYHNNLAQAIENLHCIDASIELLETSKFKKEKKPNIKIKTSTGVGVLEAPRGLLYHSLKINKAGRIDNGTLVTPTAQNQIRMENDIKTLVNSILDKPEDYIRHEIEKLIRAYDPCMTCASSFLKIKWI